MYKLSFIFLRNKKNTIIHILLFTMINLIICLFCVLYFYNNYLVNNCRNYRENREFMVLSDSDFIDMIKKNFEVENVENIFDPFYKKSYYLVLLKNYKDIESFNKYLKNNNIEGHLASTKKMLELETVENQAKIFNFVFVFILIISFIMFFFLIKSIIFNDKKYFMLLKALGYNVLQENYIFFIKAILIMILSIVLSLLMIYFFYFWCLLIFDGKLKSLLISINVFKIGKIYVSIILTLVIINIFINMVSMHFQYQQLNLF